MIERKIKLSKRRNRFFFLSVKNRKIEKSIQVSRHVIHFQHMDVNENEKFLTWHFELYLSDMPNNVGFETSVNLKHSMYALFTSHTVININTSLVSLNKKIKIKIKNAHTHTETQTDIH